MTTPGDTAARLHAVVEARFDEEVAFLAELVRTPSDNPPGDCAAHAGRAAALLEGLGFRVERHAVPQAEAAAAGLVSVVNLVVRERFGDGPVVALNAHGDVVAPGLGWSVDPYAAVVRDGRMYGRGVAVSKSDFATYAFALLALKATRTPLAGTVELHFTHDEETGGTLGPKWLLEHGLTKPDYAICAGFAHGITVAHNGCLHLEVELTGRSAHAAKPETGADALEAAASVLADLYALRRSLVMRRSRTPGIATATMVVGLIEGGINTNVVPDRVRLRLDRRVLPEEDFDAAEHELRVAIEGSAARHAGIACRIERILAARPFVPLPGQERLVEALARQGQAVLGEALATHGVPIYTDARHYAAAGVPTVLYGAGPRTLEEANGHRADENLVLADLRAATKVVAGALADLLR